MLFRNCTQSCMYVRQSAEQRIELQIKETTDCRGRTGSPLSHFRGPPVGGLLQDQVPSLPLHRDSKEGRTTGSSSWLTINYWFGLQRNCHLPPGSRDFFHVTANLDQSWPRPWPGATPRKLAASALTAPGIRGGLIAHNGHRYWYVPTAPTCDMITRVLEPSHRLMWEQKFEPTFESKKENISARFYDLFSWSRNKLLRFKQVIDNWQSRGVWWVVVASPLGTSFFLYILLLLVGQPRALLNPTCTGFSGSREYRLGIICIRMVVGWLVVAQLEVGSFRAIRQDKHLNRREEGGGGGQVWRAGVGQGFELKMFEQTCWERFAQETSGDTWQSRSDSGRICSTNTNLTPIVTCVPLVWWGNCFFVLYNTTSHYHRPSKVRNAWR